MAFMQNWPVGYQTRIVPVVQGEFQVSNDSGVVLSTVLGSCVSVCLFDDRAKIGGMNHYLLAEGDLSESGNLKYGAYAMELLINSLLKKGAARANLSAKIFGGARMSGRFATIGPRNAEFAVSFLKGEGFPVLSQDTGGQSARRLNFHPTTGQARLIRNIDAGEAHRAMAVQPKAAPPKKPDVVLF
jgi:chemotaxis protein CheD